MSAESLIRLFLFLSGVASTIFGSFVSSKIRVYYDNRKAHLEDIKQKVLTPLRESLAERYGPLVTHASPVVIEEWGVRQRAENASATTQPDEHGPFLVGVAPDVRSETDQALYADASQYHFRKVIADAERFLTAWQTHAAECQAWVSRLSEEILAGCKLPPHPSSHGTGYIMQYRLGIFVYRRLFHKLNVALFKQPQQIIWVLEGFDGASAGGTEKDLDALLRHLDSLLEREKSTADRLQQHARVLEQDLSFVRRELNHAIAARRLHKKCDLVPFFLGT